MRGLVGASLEVAMIGAVRMVPRRIRRPLVEEPPEEEEPPPPAQFATTNADLIAHGLIAATSIHPMQEAAGATVAVDALGHANLAIGAVGPTPGVATAVTGRTAWRFLSTDGGNTRLDAPNVATYNLSAPVAIGAVLRTPTAPATNTNIFGQRDAAAPNAGFEFYMSAAGLVSVVHDHGAAQTTISATGSHVREAPWSLVLVMDELNGVMFFDTSLASPASAVITTTAPTQLVQKYSAGRNRIASASFDLLYHVVWHGASVQGWLANRAARFAAFRASVGGI